MVLVVLALVALLGVAYLLLAARGRLSSRGRERERDRARGRRSSAGPRGGPAFPSLRRALWLKRLTILLLVGAAVSLAVALAQFRLSSRRVSEGTVILVVDASQSMEQTDVAPSRLVAAENAARAFLDKLPQDFRVGVVTFAGEATVRLRPTADRDRVVGAFDSLTTANGTVIGDGLTAALDTLEADRRQNGEGPAAVLLLSDGLDTGSLVPPERAAERARSLGVPVFTVAIGEPGASNPDGGSGANFELLRQMADTTDASTFTAATADELTHVYEKLGTRLSYDLAISDFGAVFVVIAVVLGIGAAVTLLLSIRSRY